MIFFWRKGLVPFIGPVLVRIWRGKGGIAPTGNSLDVYGTLIGQAVTANLVGQATTATLIAGEPR